MARLGTHTHTIIIIINLFVYVKFVITTIIIVKANVLIFREPSFNVLSDSFIYTSFLW